MNRPWESAHRTSEPLVRPYLKVQEPPPAEWSVPGSPRLRPFLLTGGRARPDSAEIVLEAQVVATRQGLATVSRLSFEHGDIVTLCAEPLSLAEISARLSFHLNVVRVIVGDLHAAGYLAVTTPHLDAPHDVETLQRIIRALKSLC
ncbi:DUF742 domain-containing protein [Streptacidiphilus sp. ASG 303]|uniref:DUF742 domain-containing protein n=1 Tax=Streptacidiphilus sp. ASG 303 TaxID=2896847 RepID=UPI001E4301F3|nr:DUF742 domain-containing protein [Streptacidiphilus sp. ASG 303]MCD0484115.1 DUF742 domain-containing protein [Streptacidiphilus sp. ASG 303]